MRIADIKWGDVVLVSEHAIGTEKAFAGRHAVVVRSTTSPITAKLLPLDRTSWLLLYPGEIDSIVDPHVARLLYGEIDL